MPNLVWSFAPWFVFIVIYRLTSLEAAVVAGVLAALVVFGRALIHHRIHLFDVAGLLYFLGLGAALVFLTPGAVEPWGPYVQLGSHILLTLLVFGSILVGHPFTEPYARETTPRQFWDTAEFHATNRRISAVWGLAFLVGTLSLIAAASIDARPVLLHVIVPLGALYAAFKYTEGQQDTRTGPEAAT
jgi:hypothetical protein